MKIEIYIYTHVLHTRALCINTGAQAHIYTRVNRREVLSRNGRNKVGDLIRHRENSGRV